MLERLKTAALVFCYVLICGFFIFIAASLYGAYLWEEAIHPREIDEQIQTVTETRKAQPQG